MRLNSLDIEAMSQTPSPAPRGEKRRSDRLMLTIPLRVSWQDAQGRSFEADARTLTLNRHGARIHVLRPLVRGSVVRLTNLISRRDTEFRVVGPVSPHTEKGGEWGVELVDGKANIWGIQFPPAGKDEADSAALLECRVCHSVALMHVSLVEVEVLETSGILTKPCETCGKQSLWGHAEKQVAMGAPAEEAAMVAEAAQAARGAELRRHRRVALQLPVLVRDYYGGTEISKSENVSKGGFCFISEKNYIVGEGVVVACPYSTSEHSIEVRAKIVRCQPVEGTSRKVYGVRYDTPPA